MGNNKGNRQKNASATRRKRRNKVRASRMTGLSDRRLALPSNFSGVLAFSEVKQLAPAASTVTANVYRLNSVYDPDFTGVGTTAYGYTTFSGVYGRYRVLSAYVEVSYQNLTANPITVFLSATPVTTVGIDINKILAQRHVWFRNVSGSNGPNGVKHTMHIPIHKIYGVPSQQVRVEDDFAAVTGTSPNNGVYLHVGVWQAGTVAGVVNYHIRIEYKTLWSLPLEIAA